MINYIFILFGEIELARKMTEEEMLKFLAEGTKTGKLATVRKNGKPHTVPIWFVINHKNLVFTTMNTSIKARNILNYPYVALTVDDQTPPYSFVTIEGKAKILDTTDEEKLKWTTKIAERYMGVDLAESFGKRNAVPEEYLVSISMDKVIAYWNVSE